MSGRWVDDATAGILTDLYQLTMTQAYLARGRTDEAVFDLFFRRLPATRNVLITAGLDDVLHYVETICFPPEVLAYLETLGMFTGDFLSWLESFRFTGTIEAMPEGTPCFANEPVLIVHGPLPEAQLLETFILNQITFQTMIASKAMRVVSAAAGRKVVEFGLRRLHGADAGIKAARASALVGVDATSNVLAGMRFALPVAGTMAHSYVEIHADELEAFEEFASIYPDTVLLVDTYDTLAGVNKVIELARRLGDAFAVKAIRLDSGDLATLSSAARHALDDAGLRELEIFVSGSLDEHAIARLVEVGAPIDGFGVGTRMGVSQDAPSLDSVYKLVEYDGVGTMKLSSGKRTRPGHKQVRRRYNDGVPVEDVVALADEDLEGRPLLEVVFGAGSRTDAGRADLETRRESATAAIKALPPALRALDPAVPPFPVRPSPGLAAITEELERTMTIR